MRDYLCNKEDLEETINFNYEWIEEDKEEISQLKDDIEKGIQRYPAVPEEIIYDTQKTILTKYRELIRAKYSLGENCESIEKLYYEGFPYIELVGYDDAYVNMLHYITLGVLLEIPRDYMQTLVEVIDKEEVDDLLFDFFINAYGLKRKIQSKGYQEKKPYSDIIDIIHVAESDKAKASKMLTDYIEKKWLKGHASYGWMTLHKKPGYYGLWSFEAGALAKILELDDENLKDNNHYPYDLLHFKNGLTFEKALNQELHVTKV